MANQSRTHEDVGVTEVLHPPVQAQPLSRVLLACGSTISGEVGIEPQIGIYCDETGCHPVLPE